MFARRATRAREREVSADLALVVDLFRLTITAGGNVYFAMRTIGAHVEGPLGKEIHQAVCEIDDGSRVADALEAVMARTSESVRKLVVAVVSAERYGSPLSDSLERLSFEVRLDQERKAEIAARRLSVEILFPVACFTLPAFALLTVAPLIAGSIGSLALSFH